MAFIRPIYGLYTAYIRPIHGLYTAYTLPIYGLYTTYIRPIHGRAPDKSASEKFDNFQMKAIKWILPEEELSYHSCHCYVRKCRLVNILPLSCRFDLNDLILFQKVVNNYIPVNVPPHLKLYVGGTRLHSTHSDYRSVTPAISSLKALRQVSSINLFSTEPEHTLYGIPYFPTIRNRSVR